MTGNDGFDDIFGKDDEIPVITLVQGRIDDQDFWAYVRMTPAQFDDFNILHNSSEPYKLTDYGEILAYKLGEKAPSAEDKTRFCKEHGLDPEFMNELREAAKSLGNMKPLKPG